MPRPERPVDATAGPVERFAAELRILRAECGITYRDLASAAHFSKATLSSAAAGHRLPTWEVTRAYVRACGGDPEDWRDRWQAASTGTRQSADTSASAIDRDNSGRSSEAQAGFLARQTSRRLTRRAPLIIVAAVLIAGVALGAIWAGSTARTVPRTPSHPTSSASAPTARFQGAKQPITDDSDPEKTRCALDPRVETLDSVQINTAAENLLGIAQLRYSPHCQAAWGRFLPSGRMTQLEGAVITITARRPATATTGTPYRVTFDEQAAFGNILTTQRGCVQITVTINAADGSGASTTRCER